MNIKIENWKLFILSIFYVIFAVLSYRITREQFLHFFMIAGIVVALVGLFQILVYFFKKDYLKPNEFSFSFGVLYLLAGIIIACKPEVIVNNYPLVVSGLVVLDCVLRLQYSMNLFRLDDRQWKLHLVLALIPLIAGMCLILIPMQEKALHNYFSFLLIFDAIAIMYTVIYYKRIVRIYEKRGQEYIEEKEE